MEVPPQLLAYHTHCAPVSKVPPTTLSVTLPPATTEVEEAEIPVAAVDPACKVNALAGPVALVAAVLLVTVMYPVPTPVKAGDVQVICVALFTAIPTAAVPPKLTVDPASNPVPAITTVCPPAAHSGADATPPMV